MTPTSPTLLLIVSWMVLGSVPLRGQESADRTAELLARRKAAIEKPVFQSLPWHLDFAVAKQRAAASGKPIFAYFTRSYSPCGPCEALERGPLQSEAFAEFADRVVLYLHITSRTPDEPERDLLERTMGVQSWPSLAFLDSGGRRIARQRVRSVVGFAQTLEQLRQREMLARDASEDDVAARKLLVLDILVLDVLDFSEAAARFAALDGFAESGRRAIESRLVELEVRHHASGLGSGDMMAVAEAMIAMLNDGRIPAAPSPAFTFWSSILFGAEQMDDVELFARGVAGMERAFGDDEGMAAVVAGYRKKLEAFR